MRRFWGLVLVLLIVLGVGSAAAEANVRNPLAIDMVIVIDNSKKMGEAGNQTGKYDPSGLRFDAAAALISMCDTEYSRATYFMFAEDLYLFSETSTGNVIAVKPEDLSLANISDSSNKTIRSAIMNQLTGDKIRSGHGTKSHRNYGKALNAAVDLLCKDDNGNRKVILLLTGGKGDSSDSQDTALAAREKALANGIEIYTVLLKDRSGEALMQQLATGENHYKFAASAEDLSEVFNNFYADMIGSDAVTLNSIDAEDLSDGLHALAIQVPNQSVAEINVIMPLKGVAELNLCKPNGQPVDANRDSVLVSTSKYFAMYKIISPEAGDWKLKYRTEGSSNISVQYIFSYSVQTDVSVSAPSISKHEPVTVSAVYLSNDMPTRDSLLYNVPAELVLRKDEKVVERVSMPSDANGYSYTFDNLSRYGTGAYSAVIHFEGDGLLRESDPVPFELINDPPVLAQGTTNGDSYAVQINTPSDPESYAIQDKEWDLSTLVTDPNGDPVLFSISALGADVDCVLNGSMLKISTKKDTGTSGAVTVHTEDNDGGKGPELVFNVQVTDYEDRYDVYTAAFDEVHGAQKNSTYPIVLTLKDGNGNTVIDDYENLPGTIEASAVGTDGTRQTIALVRGANGKWTGELITGGMEAEYTLSCVMAAGQKTITAQALKIVVGNTAPVLNDGAKADMEWAVSINDPADPASYQVQENKWDLNSVVKDANGDALTFTIVSNSADVNASVNDANQLIISTKANTETDGMIVVACADNDGLAGPQLTFHIRVASAEKEYEEYYAKLSVSSTRKNQPVTLTLGVYKDKILITGDSNLPDTFDVTVTQAENQYPVTMTRGADGKWTGTINTISTVADYLINAALPISENVSVNAEYAFTTENTQPEIAVEPAQQLPAQFNVKPFLLWNNATGLVTLDLTTCFRDADGDALTFALNGDVPGVSVNGSTLTIDADQSTQSNVSFTITAADSDKRDSKSVTSAEISFSIHSLQTQGIIIILSAAAALILLLIIIRAAKPKYPRAYFEVQVNGMAYGDSQKLPANGGAAKKAAKLQSYSTAMARREYGAAIHSALASVMLSPASKYAIKINAEKVTGLQVRMNGVPGKKGKLANGGRLEILMDNMQVAFVLRIESKAGKAAAAKPTAQPAARHTRT